MYKFLLVLLLFIFFSCKKQERAIVQEEFVFTTTTKNESFLSLKFQNDTVLVAWEVPRNTEVYYFVLENSEMDSINFFLDSIKNFKIESEYYDESLVDGSSSQFLFYQPMITIFIYGDHDSKEIKQMIRFSDYLLNMYQSRRRIVNNRAKYVGQRQYWTSDIDFGNVERFQIPAPPSDY